ncbi:MAG: ANTAR domain-containing response regulator [Lachnospiraceae bacterium]
MNVIVVFPKPESAQQIKKILQQNGFDVQAVCSTGAQALQQAGGLDSGIIVCAYRFADMMFTELKEYLSPNFEMLLIASPENVAQFDLHDIVSLNLPLKVHELVQTMNMINYSFSRKRKKKKLQPRERSEDQKAMITEAKELLMERNHMSEDEAHRYIQKRSMDNGTDLVETAQMILSLMNL